jgi:hypothetical protein
LNLPTGRYLSSLLSACMLPLVVVIVARGCSSDADQAAPDGTAAARDAGFDQKAEATARDVVHEAKVETGQEATTEEAASSEGVPAGWQPWTGWSSACPLWVPSNAAEVAPIEWEPCPDIVPSSIQCRKMKESWAGATSWVFPRAV